MPSTPARLVLVGAPRAEREEKIRRFRLARLRVESELDRSRGAERESNRFAQLRRQYD